MTASAGLCMWFRGGKGQERCLRELAFLRAPGDQGRGRPVPPSEGEDVWLSLVWLFGTEKRL